MNSKMTELSKKEIVNINDGEILGVPYDIVIDTQTKLVCSIVARKKGVFGISHGAETEVEWEVIKLIGTDAILVDIPPSRQRSEDKRNFFERIFG